MSEGGPSIERTPRWWPAARRRLLISAAVLAVYFLSFGPMYWVWYESKYIGGSPLWAAVYEPLVLASTAIPPLGWMTATYADMWIG